MMVLLTAYFFCAAIFLEVCLRAPTTEPEG